MSTEVVTLTRWTCDRCGITHNNMEAGEGEIPIGWACTAVSVADEEEPKVYDLCGDCAKELTGFFGDMNTARRV